MSISFDDLIPAQKQTGGISFDDLIPATPPQGEVSASPAVAENSGLVGGEATGTVQRGFQLPPVMDPFGINKPVTAPAPQATFKAGTPGYSVMGDLKPVRPMPVGVRPEFVQGVTQELLSMTPEQRAAVMQEDSLRGTIAKRLMMQVAEIRAKNAQENTPERARRREFAEANPLTGALASGAANTLKATINIPTVAADLFNQTVVNPIGQAVGLGSLPRVGMMPGTESLESMAGDYMPAVGKQSLAQAIDKGQFQDWFMTNMSAQAPQIGQTLSMAMVPALRPLMLPTVGAQEAASEYAEGDDSRVAAVKGTIATLAEMLPLKAFDKVRDRILALPVGAQRGLLAEAATRATAGGAALTVQSLVGGIEEGLTEFGKNVTDVAIGRDTPLGKNVPEAMVLGTGAGGVMATPNVARALLQGDTESPAAQLARALQGGVDNTSINQDATRRAAVDSLNPARAQMERIEPTLNFDDLIPPSTNQPGEANGNQVQGQEAAQAPAVLSNEPTPIDPASGGAIDPAPASAFAPAAPVAGATPGEPAPSVAPAQPEPPAALTPPVGNDALQPSAIPTDTQRVSTVTGRQVETRMRVVDASELQAATGDLQPRDRSRASSDEQINTIASQLDPQRLGFSSEADRGAPIIGPDMIVESGNGRVMAIRRAFEMFPERAQAYRDYLASQGYDTTGVAMPVLVRERVTPMTLDERRAFVQEANQAATMALTPVEQANMDTAAMTDSVVDAWRGGDVGDAQNRDFVSAFVGALPQAQRNALLDGDGRLSPDGATRIRRALLAAAYDDRDLLTELIESADDNIRSIGNALFDSAAPWLQMRRMARDGVIDQAYDTTAQLVQAARTVSQLRRQRQNIKDWLAQDDLTSERDPVVDAFVRGFYNEGLTRAVGRDAINDVLQAYARIAKEQDTGSMFGDAPTPAQLAQGAVEQRNERNKAPEQQGLLDAAAGDVRPGQGVQQRGRQAQDSTVQRGGARSDRQGQPGEVQRDTDTGRPAQDAGTQGRRAQAPAGEVNERAPVSARRDAAAEASDRQGLPRNDGRQENQRIKGAGTDIFSAISFTNRQSIYKDAWIDLGQDPDQMAMLPPERQFKLLSDGLRKTFGLSAVQRSDRSNIRLSIDQLQDAYRNMQFMAAALDLPTKAIGLNGTLALGLTSQGKYLGAYYPQGTDGKSSDGLVTNSATIVMPGRSNSFAHEWGHALDYFIADNYQGVVDNLSGMVRKGDSLSQQMPENVRDSFRLLMNSLFFDNAELSGRIMDLERRIETAAHKGIDATKLKTDLDRLLSGASQSRTGRSQFAQSSREFGGNNPDYWTKPTEMLARSFEAYVAHKVEAIGGTTEFIAKGDDAYLSDADERLAKTFPKDSDRYNIFRSYDLLFDAIREQSLLNIAGDAVANVPANERIFNSMVYYQAQIDSSTSERVATAWEAERTAFEKRRRELDRLAARPKDPRSIGQRITDAPAAVFHSHRGVMLSLEERYRRNGNAQAADAIRNISKRLATDPGSGKETIQGGTYAETVFLETTRRLNRLANIVRENGLDQYKDDQLAELTDVLTSVGEEAKNVSPQILKAANELRSLMDGTYYYNMNSGMDIGYVADVGYLPRMLDNPVVMEAGPQFISDAAQVYEIVFERDTMRASDDSVDIDEAISALKTRIKEARIDSKNDVNLQAYAEAVKELRKLQSALNKANASEDADAIDSAQAALNEFIESSMGVFDDAFDYVNSQWSNAAAVDWQTRILYGSVENFSSHSPQGSFTKRRVLPKEADKILAKYYTANPVERISRYIEQSVRKSEYTRLFGNGQLNDQLKALIESKVIPEDQQIIRSAIQQVTGTDQSNMSDRFKRMAANIHSVGNMTLLGRVVLTSLVEQMTIALQTGKVRDAFLSTALTMREALNTKDVREQRAIADLLGIVGGDMTQEIISNRLGGTTGESGAMQKISSNFFRRVGLTGLTNVQRRVAMQLSGRYVMEMASDADTGTGQKKRFAMAELRDAGMTEMEAQAFLAWTREFRGRTPGIYDLADSKSGELTRMGNLYGLMVGRLVNQSIQNPTAVDRPWAANTVIGRMAFGLLSFSMGFMRNVLIKNVKKVQREYEAEGARGAAKVAALQVVAPLSALFMGHLLVTVAREALLNPEKWDEEKKKDNLEWWLLQLAFSRAGFTGLADPLYNALLGVKYQRDLANIALGAGNSYFFQALERIAKYFVMNSENTNSAERNTVRGLYELLAMPLAASAVGYLPAGPLLGYGMGLSYAYLSSPRAKENVQDIVAGEADTKKSKTGEQKKSNTGGW